ncbi:MAG: ROK family protein [Chloroflexi bacterium]|nr:ROK family protein [Chloroflexota bacterium]
MSNERAQPPQGSQQLVALPSLAIRSQFATAGIVIGVDIGGTNQTVAAARLDGEVITTRRRRLQPNGIAEDVVANVFEMIDEALDAAKRAQEHLGDERLLRVGVGFGGPVDQKHGCVITSHHVPGWDGYPLRATIEQKLDTQAVLDNDANAAALGEALFGAGRGVKNLLYVNVGTGIGAGIVLNGALYHGEHGVAGEIGHVTVMPGGPPCGCGKLGCLEALASGRSIGRRAREAAIADAAAGAALIELAGGEAAAIEGPHVFAAAAAGDALAQRLIEEPAQYLGLALAGAANLLDPGMIIVGGGLSDSGDLLFVPLRDAVRRHLLPSLPMPAVVPAEYGYNAGIIGALALAFDGL